MSMVAPVIAHLQLKVCARVCEPGKQAWWVKEDSLTWEIEHAARRQQRSQI